MFSGWAGGLFPLFLLVQLVLIGFTMLGAVSLVVAAFGRGAALVLPGAIRRR